MARYRHDINGRPVLRANRRLSEFTKKLRKMKHLLSIIFYALCV